MIVEANKNENFFSILSRVRKEMISNEKNKEMNEMTEKILRCTNQESALKIIQEYVEIKYE